MDFQVRDPRDSPDLRILDDSDSSPIVHRECQIDKPTIIKLLNELDVDFEFNSEMSLEELIDLYEEMYDRIEREARERAERVELCVYAFVLVQKGIITIEENNHLMQREASNAEIVRVLSRYLPRDC